MSVEVETNHCCSSRLSTGRREYKDNRTDEEESKTNNRYSSEDLRAVLG
jgi:hypothetical protein